MVVSSDPPLSQEVRLARSSPQRTGCTRRSCCSYVLFPTNFPSETPLYVFLGHPHREQWHQIGRRFRQRFHLDFDDRVEPPYTPPPHGTCRVQAVRSVSDWSHGVLTEHSIQNACTFARFHLLYEYDDILTGLVITARHSANSRSQPLHLYR